MASPDLVNWLSQRPGEAHDAWKMRSGAAKHVMKTMTLSFEVRNILQSMHGHSNKNNNNRVIVKLD